MVPVPSSGSRLSPLSVVGLLALSGAGAAICTYLSVLHLAFLRGEFLGGPGCSAASAFLNCHAVTASRWGMLFGIPLAYWGALGYAMTATLTLIAWQFESWTRRALLLLAVLSVVFVMVDGFLGTLMVTRLRTLCVWCIATYVVNLSLAFAAQRLLGASWLTILREFPSAARAWRPSRQDAVPWVWWGVVATSVAGLLVVHAASLYLMQGPPGALQAMIAEHVRRHPRVTVELADSPVRGQVRGPIQIVEFSDFLCPACRRATRFNRILLADRRQEIAMIFKHFPLDLECNPAVARTVHAGACRLAAVAICAQEQGKFWEFHDLVLEGEQEYDPRRLGGDLARIGINRQALEACLASGRPRQRLQQDVAEAQRLGIVKTPTYIVNGTVMPGVVTPAVLTEVLRAQAEAAAPLTPSGESATLWPE